MPFLGGESEPTFLSLFRYTQSTDAKAIEMGIFNETTQERMQELEERKRLYNDELTAEKNRQKYALKKEFNEYLDNLDNIMEFIDAPREITAVSEEFRKRWNQ